MPNRVDIRKLLAEEPETFLRQSMLEQLAVLHVISNDELLAGDNAVLHDFRVAVRTLRTRLKFFRPYFKKPDQIKLWSHELKWIDEHVQRLRDIEIQSALLNLVAAEKLQNLISKPAKYQMYRKGVLALQKELAGASEAAKAKLEIAVQSNRSARMFEDVKIGLLLATFNSKKLAKLSEELTQLHATKVKAISKALQKPGLSKQSHKKLHSLRLDCKRARYLGEAIRSPLKHLAEAQTVLGEINDLSILSKWLEPRAMQRRRDRKLIILLLLEVNQTIANRRSQLPTLKSLLTK